MQDEVNEKVLSLCVSGGKISARILKETMEKALAEMERSQRKERHHAPAKQKEEKQTITDGNIKSFEKCARKYHVLYSLMKDKSASPPRYFVFFRAKDVDSITAAFKEYTGRTLNKTKKPSVRKKLEIAKERVAKHREKEKTKHKDRGQEL